MWQTIALKAGLLITSIYRSRAEGRKRTTDSKRDADQN